MNKRNKLIIACATVIEEMLPLLPPDMEYRTLDFGLHSDPAKLHYDLQEVIDESKDKADFIVLGYGFCSQGVIGLCAVDCTLILPRVDNCIAIFLGSEAAYIQQCRSEPGTYYLTKNWIEMSNSPFVEYDKILVKSGREHAERVIRLMLKNYKRLALINTGQYELERYRDYVRRAAEQFGLNYEEIEGSTIMLKKMIHGPYDDEFIIVGPGESIRFEHFFPGLLSANRF